MYFYFTFLHFMNRLLLSLIAGIAILSTPSCLFGQFRTTVPYSTENRKMTVEVEIEGHRGRFLIDTGAPCSLTHSFMKRSGITPTDSVRVQDSNGYIMTTRLTTLNALKLGSITFNSLQALCLEEGNIAETFKIDGIIGYNLLKMGIVKFDSRHHTFTITNVETGLGSDSIQGIPMIKDPFIVYIPVCLGENCQDTVMFDCGASSFYSMSVKNYHRLSRTNAFELVGKGTGILSAGATGVEQASTKYRLKIPHFSLGNASFRNVTTVTTHAADSRIGAEILEHGDVIIDYRKNLFYYLPFVSGETPDMYQKEWDAVITVIDNYLTVGMVWNPEESPLKGGERIIEIEGKKYDKVDLYKATMTNLVQLPEKEAHIKYIDKETGKIKSTVIRRK